MRAPSAVAATLTRIADAAKSKGLGRGALAIDPAAALKLDGTFALHPALPRLRELYAGGEATFLHAVASPYRDRSHFDAQNVLETGGKSPYQLRDGWMNRLLGMLPHSGKSAVAFSPAVPLALPNLLWASSQGVSLKLRTPQSCLRFKRDQAPNRTAQWSQSVNTGSVPAGLPCRPLGPGPSNS